METVSVLCNSCGAALEIESQSRYVTCQYCNTHLSIKKSESVVYSEVLDELRSNSQKTVEKLNLVSLQNELERIDREWLIDRQQYETDGKPPSNSGISLAGSILMGVLAIGFLIFWSSTTSEIGAPAFFPLFGLAGIAFVIFGIINSSTKASNYTEAKTAYESKRAKLLQQIEEAK